MEPPLKIVEIVGPDTITAIHSQLLFQYINCSWVEVSAFKSCLIDTTWVLFSSELYTQNEDKKRLSPVDPVRQDNALTLINVLCLSQRQLNDIPKRNKERLVIRISVSYFPWL